MKSRYNQSLTIILIILTLGIIAFFIANYIKSELENYDIYNDYSRAVVAKRLSFNKSIDVFYPILRDELAFTEDAKISIGDIIYDFAGYEIIPILNYLESSSEDSNLIAGFNYIGTFLTHFENILYDTNDDLIVINDNGKRYTYEDGVYTYIIKKQIITKDTFNELYYEYLDWSGSKDLKSHFINILYMRDEEN